jgi:S1-C subfamily serine protease
MIPVSETAAQAALDKLRSNRRPTASELVALELVIRLLRPAPLTHGGRPDPLPRHEGASLLNPELMQRWTPFADAVEPYVYSVGRIDRAGGGKDAAAGTGFLVREDLLLTNRHVVDALSLGTAALEPGQAVVSFYKEDELPDAEAPVPIAGVAAVHPALDMALLALDPPQSRAVPPLASAPPAPGATVVALGYPWQDRSSPLFAPVIFGSRYGVKRAAVGEVTALHPDRLFHDCSTLGGNSGSPLFALDDAQVVGLHASGLFMYRNEAVPGADVASFVAQVP